MIGEYERAFYGGQYASMASLFQHYGIALWAPEVGGRIDYHAEDHEQTMLALGLQSKREITGPPTAAATATPAPPPGTRPRNTYVREDQILPHLAALAILLVSDGQAQGSSTLQVSGPC